MEIVSYTVMKLLLIITSLFVLASSDDVLCEWTKAQQPIMLHRLNQTLHADIHATNICNIGTTFNESGIFQSPNYPDNYDNNLDCYVYIYAPKGYNIEINIDFFSMQYKWDYFYVFDSEISGDSSWNQIATLNGQYEDSLKYTLKNNVKLRFYTNSIIRCLGIHLSYSAKPTFSISPPSNPSCPGPDILFILDRSQMIIPDFYNKNITAFLRDVTLQFGFSDDSSPQFPYSSKFGIIQFSDNSDLTIPLASYTRYEFLSQVERFVQYSNGGGNSNVTKALLHAFNVFSGQGSNLPKPSRAIVLITNDISTYNFDATLSAMNKLKAIVPLPTGIIVPGLSGNPSNAQQHLADLLGNPSYAFGSLASAISGIPALASSTFSCQSETICSDLIFVGEATTSIGWDTKLRFLKLAQQLAAATTKSSQQRFAVALFGVEIYKKIEFQTFDDFNQTINSLIINVAQSNSPNGGQTFLAPILNHLYSTLGSDISPSNYAVLFMGETGAIRDPSQAFTAAQNVASKGADIYVLDQSASGSSSQLWSILTNNRSGHIVNGTSITYLDQLFNTFQTTLLQDFGRMNC